MKSRIACIKKAAGRWSTVAILKTTRHPYPLRLNRTHVYAVRKHFIFILGPLTMLLPSAVCAVNGERRSCRSFFSSLFLGKSVIDCFPFYGATVTADGFNVEPFSRFIFRELLVITCAVAGRQLERVETLRTPKGGDGPDPELWTKWVARANQNAAHSVE
jgi:hypothetical protein